MDRRAALLLLAVVMGCEGSESGAGGGEMPAPGPVVVAPQPPPPAPREPVDPYGPDGGTLRPDPPRPDVVLPIATQPMSRVAVPAEVVSPLGEHNPDLHMTPRAWLGKLAAADRDRVKKICALRKASPCERFMGGHDSAREVIAQLPTDRQQEVETYCAETNSGKGCQTPLVLSFAPDRPVELVGHRPTEKTPWLARDVDGDHVIEDRELFHGFGELAALDANGDGVIDARDPAFADLVLTSDHSSVWSPVSGVARALPLANQLVPRCNDAGDCEGERASLLLLDGSTAALIDVYMVTQ